MSLTADRVLSISPQMVEELATGVEDCKAIALRYGFTEEEWTFLEHYPPLEKAVNLKIAEFAANGRTFKNTSKFMAEKLLNDTFMTAMSVETPVKDKVATLQLLARLADLEPKQAVDTGNKGFSITINLPSSIPQRSVDTSVVDVEAKAVPAEKSLELKFVSDKGEPSE